MAIPPPRIPAPNPTGGGAFRAELRTSRNTPFFDSLRDRIKTQDLSPAMKEMPDIIRFGPGGLRKQIETRAWYTPRGGIIPWVEPAYVRGGVPFEAQRREQVIWDAALGRNAAGFSSYGKRYAEVGINESQVKAISTALGNQLPVPPDVSYAGFVTGGIGTQELKQKYGRRAIARKGIKSAKTYPVKKLNYAMYWFLKLTFGYRMTDEEFAQGIYTPAKRMSPNPLMIESCLDLLSTWVRTGKTTSEVAA